VQREEQRTAALEAGAVEVLLGDMLEAAVLARATAGISALYFIAPNMHPAEGEMARIAIKAAKDAGISHFLYHSVLHPQIEAMPHHWQKMRVEELLFTAGLPFTIFQPAAYMQNLLGSWAAISQQGRYLVPYPVSSRLSLVDLQDVAEAAAIVLTHPHQHRYASYELVGTSPLSQTELAQTLSQLLGRAVVAEEAPLGGWQRKAENAGISPHTLDWLLRMFRYYAAYGFAGNPTLLTHLLGRQPTSLAQFIQRQLSMLAMRNIAESYPQRKSV